MYAAICHEPYMYAHVHPTLFSLTWITTRRYSLKLGVNRWRKARKTLRLIWHCLPLLFHPEFSFPPPASAPSLFKVYPSVFWFSPFSLHFSSKVTMVLICHAIADTTVNLKLWEDWEKLVSADLWDLPNYWYKCKIQCERQLGDICLSYAVDTVCMWLPGEREIGHLCCLWGRGWASSL